MGKVVHHAEATSQNFIAIVFFGQVIKPPHVPKGAVVTFHGAKPAQFRHAVRIIACKWRH